MAGFELKMPKLGESVTEGTIGKWLKQPGEKVNKYDLLVEVQTDKVNTEIPSPVSGTLKEVKVQEGQTVPIGTLLAVFDTADGETAIDISEIDGTGLGGRVSRKDVEDFIAERQSQQQAAGRVVPAQPQAESRAVSARPAPAPSLAGDELVPLTQMRRAIANNMVQAWSAPHAHAVMEVDMTDLMRYREKVRNEFLEREGFDLSPAAFIAKAVVDAIRTVPQVNSSWTDQGLVRHREINLGYAVALGEDGLIVPVIKDADGKSIAGLMRAIRDVVDRAKARRLTLDDLSGGTFTLNNTGPLGTVVSSPIVPPGQAAILSSESIRKRLVVTDDDAIAIRQMMNIVIGFDHRVVGGPTAARFLTAVRDWLQTTGTSVPVY